jgi:hypothetical protein
MKDQAYHTPKRVAMDEYAATVENWRYFEKSLLQCHFIQYKSHMKSPKIHGRESKSVVQTVQTNWERSLIQIAESPNYVSATENMFGEVIKWASCVFFRQYNFILKLRLHTIK